MGKEVEGIYRSRPCLRCHNNPHLLVNNGDSDALERLREIYFAIIQKLLGGNLQKQWTTPLLGYICTTAPRGKLEANA